MQLLGCSSYKGGVLKRRRGRDSRVRGTKRGARGPNDVHPCVSASVSVGVQAARFAYVIKGYDRLSGGESQS